MAKFKKRSNPTRKATFKAYEDSGRSKKNAERKLAKHLKKHPKDAQSASHKVPNYKKKKGGTQ